MVLPRPVRAVIFDMDGLLVNTEAVYRDCMFAVAAERGLEFPFSVFVTMIGLPRRASDRRVLDHFGEDFPIDAFNDRTRELVHASIDAGVDLKAGVVEILDHLDSLGLPRAICTSSSPPSVAKHLGASGIIPRFDTVVARGDYQNGKPAPDPYLKAAERLGVAPEFCLALEDSHNGVRAASSAGMMTIMVPDLLEATDEMQGLCIRIARDLHEVRGWIG